jgi:glycosyltransferase involved in cell wall biosynthesis
MSLRAADVVLVHNEAMRTEALAQGWPASALRVLEDVPPVLAAATNGAATQSYVNLPRPWVIVPGSFSADEPIREVLEAARRAPEIGFVLTGSLKSAGRNRHPLDDLPANVAMPGFLPTEAFDALLSDADVIMGLTRFADTQLSVCNEALGFGKPLVTSDTRLLRELFGSAAVFVETEDPDSIVEGCRQALAEAELRAALSQRLADERLRNWQHSQWAEVQALLRVRT